MDPTVVSLRVAATDEREVSTTGAAASTLTVSASPDTLIDPPSVTVWPTVRPMFSWTSVVNPGSV